MPIADKDKYPLIAGAIKQDGLYDLGWYLGYTNGDKEATLDGKFTARDLQEIAKIHVRSSTACVRYCFAPHHHGNVI